MEARVAEFPCGCRAWRYGRDEGFVPCPPHMMEHQAERMKKDMSGGFGFSEVKCDCLFHRAERAKRTPFDYILDRHEEERAIQRGCRGGSPDRTEEAAHDGNGIQVGMGNLSTVDVSIDPKCDCLWEKLDGAWALVFPCLEHVDRVRALEFRRNAHPSSDVA